MFWYMFIIFLFIKADLVGGDAEELGDLSDVPERYLQEVVELIRSLPSPDEDQERPPHDTPRRATTGE